MKFLWDCQARQDKEETTSKSSKKADCEIQNKYEEIQMKVEKKIWTATIHSGGELLFKNEVQGLQWIFPGR